VRTFAKRKRSGGIRRIFAPSDHERLTLQALLPALAGPQTQLPAAHGFRAGRGVVTAAQPHVRAAVTVSLDLSDFFDRCTLPLARERGVPDAVLAEKLAFVGTPRAARQGLPTSPAVANLCARPLDNAILDILRQAGHATVCVAGLPPAGTTAAYTRYADDLSISLWTDPGQEELLTLIAQISDAAQRCGLPLNMRKTRIQRAARGRREICGVLVDDRGIYPTRRHRRQLRAAVHNLRWHPGEYEQERMRGLAAWCQLVPPKGAR